MRGRGAADNIANRFERLEIEPDPEGLGGGGVAPSTRFYIDRSKSVIARNDSPDIPFDASVNPYRGCEHGCAYCYARPTHEYLGFSSGLDFETQIMVKANAPELLRRELSSKRWRPQTVAMSGVTDPYQPVERKLELTRKCLRVLADFRNPVGIVTKNHLVTRDIDILRELAAVDAVSVAVSISTLDADLARRLEPRASSPEARLRAIEALSEAGIPAGVLTAPAIPALNDHELPKILERAAAAGARYAGYVVLRLPYGLKELFERWLDGNVSPGAKTKILNRVRMVRGGELNSAKFHDRMSGAGIFAEQIGRLFEAGCSKAGLNARRYPLSVGAFRRPGLEQGMLWDARG